MIWNKNFFGEQILGYWDYVSRLGYSLATRSAFHVSALHEDTKCILCALHAMWGFVRRGCVESSFWYIYMDWGRALGSPNYFWNIKWGRLLTKPPHGMQCTLCNALRAREYPTWNALRATQKPEPKWTLTLLWYLICDFNKKHFNKKNWHKPNPSQ